jgi:RNA polymerase sigma-70 factor (ECF subfamily)
MNIVSPIPLKPVQPAGGRARPFAESGEDALVEGALHDERWAQHEIWYRFAPMVHGLLRRSLSSRHDVEDLVQEVFLRVFRRLHTLEKRSALRSFVYSVGVRVISEEIRHFQVVRRAHTEVELGDLDGQSPACNFEARDLLLRIQRLLDGMKDKHRAVFILRHVEGMELREIAAGLGISLASVKRYLVSALRAIQHEVGVDDELHGKLGTITVGQLAGGNP